MVRHLQLGDFLPRDRPATFAELAHLRSTLFPGRQSSANAVASPMAAMPSLVADLESRKNRLAGPDPALPIWISGLEDQTLSDGPSRHDRIQEMLAQDRAQPISRAFIERWRAKGWQNLGATSSIPTISVEKDRIDSILSDRPARFNVVDNTNEAGEPPWYADDYFGWDVVRKHHLIIEEEASRLGVDPDLVRAIMFVENSHGRYDGPAALVDLDRTIRPMNIDAERWRGLGISRQTARDPRVNIRAGTTILKRLVDRIEVPTPRKVAALWNFTGAEHTDNEDIRKFVARVGRVYEAKPWAKPSGRVRPGTDPGSAP